jgi:aspartate racemase
MHISLSHSPKARSILGIVMLRFNELKSLVMQAIFGKEGIKAGSYQLPAKLLLKAAKRLQFFGAEAIIMGCTEIPLVLHQEGLSVNLINPNQILAEVAVKLSKGERKL